MNERRKSRKALERMAQKRKKCNTQNLSGNFFVFLSLAFAFVEKNKQTDALAVS